MAVDLDPGLPLEGASGSPVPSGPAARLSPRPVETRQAAVVRYFVAVSLSWYGDWLTTVALVVVLFEVTHNPVGPAGYVVARVAPRCLGPWLGGGLADRISPRRILVIASMVQAVATASLILFHRDHVEWGIYAAVAVAQFTGALARPSQGTILPSLVSARRLMRANATYSLINSTSIFIAPALGALVLIVSGPDLLFAIDAATFIVSAVLASTLPLTRRTPTTPRPGRVKLGMTEGLRRGLREPMIRMLAAAMFAGGLLATVAQALLVVGANDRFGSDHAVGYLYSAVGVGGVVGALVSLRWNPRPSNMRMVMVLGAFIELLSLGGFSFANSLAVAMLLLAVSSGAGDAIITWGMTSIQLTAPEGYLGRFNAVFFLAQYLGMLSGAVFALATANLLHWDRAIQIACVAVLIVVGTVAVLGGKLTPTEPEEVDTLDLEGKATGSRRLAGS